MSYRALEAMDMPILSVDHQFPHGHLTGFGHDGVAAAGTTVSKFPENKLRHICCVCVIVFAFPSLLVAFQAVEVLLVIRLECHVGPSEIDAADGTPKNKSILKTHLPSSKNHHAVTQDSF